MNKFKKIIFAIFGGADYGFGIAIPVFVALSLIKIYPIFSHNNQIILMVIAIMSSFYRAIKVWNE
jgi:hypothetical protein